MSSEKLDAFGFLYSPWRVVLATSVSLVFLILNVSIVGRINQTYEDLLMGSIYMFL